MQYITEPYFIHLTLHYIFFVGQRHFTFLRLRVGGGDSGTLAGSILPDLQQEEPSPQDLGLSPVSIT